MKQHGITLVEMLSTLAVSSILLALGIPGYGFLVDGMRLTGVTNDMVLSLNLARSEAIKRGVRVTLCSSGNSMDPNPKCDADGRWQHGWIVFVDRGLAGVRDGADAVLWAEQGQENARITARNFNGFVSYMPSGVSRGPNNLANGTLNICLAGNMRKIILNTTGRVRLQKGSC